jgi:outer membrane protein assembly factor BamB
VHAYDGIIHIESPSTTQSFTLSQFFDIWGIPLSTTQVGSATGKVTVFFTSPGKSPMLYTGDPRNLPLGDHYQIQLNVGTPIVAPVQITNWGGL